MRRSDWLPFGTRDDASVRLLCLPHAGAGAAVYRAWGRGLDPAIGLCPLEPPGRGRRRQETAFTSVSQLVDSLVAEVILKVRVPFAIFGHSAGALCAYETARQLRLRGGPEPVHLFVSGRPAPQIPMECHDLRSMSLAELAEFLRDLGGTPEEVLADQAMLESLQPTLGADFHLNEHYRYLDAPPLDIPVTAFSGTHDLGATPAYMTPWEKETTRRFVMHEIEGGHFSIFEHSNLVQSFIAEDLAISLTHR